jgi:hypothetical protein
LQAQNTGLSLRCRELEKSLWSSRQIAARLQGALDSEVKKRTRMTKEIAEVRGLKLQIANLRKEKEWMFNRLLYEAGVQPDTGKMHHHVPNLHTTDGGAGDPEASTFTKLVVTHISALQHQLASLIKSCECFERENMARLDRAESQPKKRGSSPDPSRLSLQRECCKKEEYLLKPVMTSPVVHSEPPSMPLFLQYLIQCIARLVNSVEREKATVFRTEVRQSLLGLESTQYPLLQYALHAIGREFRNVRKLDSLRCSSSPARGNAAMLSTDHDPKLRPDHWFLSSILNGSTVTASQKRSTE